MPRSQSVEDVGHLMQQHVQDDTIGVALAVAVAHANENAPFVDAVGTSKRGIGVYVSQPNLFQPTQTAAHSAVQGLQMLIVTVHGVHVVVPASFLVFHFAAVPRLFISETLQYVSA